MRFACKAMKIDPAKPRPDLIIEVADVIKSGGVIAFPTRCLYGLGADAFNSEAVDRVYEIKRRPYDRPIPVLIKNIKDLARLVRSVPQTASSIMDRFWPGRVTIVFEAKDTLPKNLTAGTGKIGVRLPQHAIASDIVNALENPITGTSANISDTPAVHWSVISIPWLWINLI